MRPFQVLIIAHSITCIDFMMRWTTLDVNGPRVGALEQNQFRLYLHSQMLCKMEYQGWWTPYKEKRLAVKPFMMRRHLGRVAANDPDFPPVPNYFISPVQSIGSYVGGGGSYDKGYTGLELATRSIYCTTYCEDMRSDLELYLTFRVSSRRQVRFKGRYFMVCPLGTWAVIVAEEDDREPRTPIIARIEEALKRFRADFHPVQDWPDFVSMLEQEQRVIGRPVKRCVCLSDEQWQAKQLVAASTQCQDSILVKRKHQEVVAWVEPGSPLFDPYSVDDEELDRANDEYYMKYYPPDKVPRTSTTDLQDNEVYRKHGPGRSFKFPGVLEIGSWVRTCVHTNAYVQVPLFLLVAVVDKSLMTKGSKAP